MAEIEAYLRTGEGPPAAPEPAPAPSQVGAVGPGLAAVPGAPGSEGRGGEHAPLGRRRVPRLLRLLGLPRLLRPLRRLFAPVSRTGLWLRLARPGRNGKGWPGDLLHPSGGHPSRHAPAGPPKWTVTRVVLVAGFLIGLLLVPVLWKKSSGGSSPDGVDHASAAPAGPGYAFLLVNRSGTPVRWNPCNPIYYQLDLSAAPPWAENDIGDAIASVSMATGITFVYDGPTSQFPNLQVPTGTSANEPPPVVIAWASPAQSQDLNLAASPSAAPAGSPASGSPSPTSAPAPPSPTSAPAAGVDSLGRTVPVTADDQATGHNVYVTGSVVIGAAASGLAEGFAPGGAGVLILHELGRLVGLGDVADPSEVMNPDVLSTQVNGLGPGDRAGLKRLGRESGCLKMPANPAIEPVL